MSNGERVMVEVGGVKVESGSKSEKMLVLNLEGKSVGEIAKELGVKYQYVYNVLSMKGVKKNSKKVDGVSVSSRIRALRSEGLGKGEISKVLSEELGREISYQWVYNVLGKGG